MIEFEEYKVKLNGLKPTLDNLEGALHLDLARREIEELPGVCEEGQKWKHRLFFYFLRKISMSGSDFGLPV